MLCMKRSTDLKRQQVIWELGLLLHQSEVEEAASIKKAKVIHSQEVLDAKVDCTKSVLEAKCNYRAAIQEAKTIRGNWLQKSEITYSKAIGKAAALRSSQSVALHREHIRLMQELEEQALREESKSHHDFLSVLSSHPASCSATPQGESGYLLPHLVGVITSITSICSTCQGTPSRRTATHGCLSHTHAQMVPMAKKVISFTRASRGACL